MEAELQACSMNTGTVRKHMELQSLSSFHQHLLRPYHAHSAILGMENRAVSKADENFPFRLLMLWIGVQSGKKEKNGHILQSAK